jgi:hypothetical protein
MGSQTQVPLWQSLKPQPPAQLPAQMVPQAPPPVPRQAVSFCKQLPFEQQPVAQVDALHGWQAPLAQPFAQVEVVELYEHVPPEQVPDDENTRSVTVSSHRLGGGELQLTPAHGSPLQTPLVQPNEHAVSIGA